MVSYYGDEQLGRYNVLPKDHKGDLPYTPPDSMYLDRCPVLFEGQHSGQYVIQPGWDVYVTSDEIQKEMALDDACGRIAEKTEGHWAEGVTFDRSRVKVVHSSWMEWPTDTNEWIKSQFNWAGVHGRAFAAHAAGAAHRAFVGVHVGSAPLVCRTIPVQGPLTVRWSSAAAVAVTEKTAEGFDHGFGAEAGVEYNGVGGKISGHVRWSNSQENSVTVEKRHADGKDLSVEEGGRRRIDVRLCAGLYSGWMIYQDHSEPNDFAAYPMRAPVHVPGCASPMTEHQMDASTAVFCAPERGLVEEYSHLAAHLSAISRDGGLRAPDDVKKYARTAQIGSAYEALR
ncbi:hypothetical protein [Streptomyces sp. SBT349]|uniref:hypothetical protein n=1 Tax=Streptomyces sp. SBT349 TaxID=1580539 RepID=UPI00066DD484|nr:hypothetical protein [Streptomyces sp. SBT349]